MLYRTKVQKLQVARCFQWLYRLVESSSGCPFLTWIYLQKSKTITFPKSPLLWNAGPTAGLQARGQKICFLSGWFENVISPCLSGCWKCSPLAVTQECADYDWGWKRRWEGTQRMSQQAGSQITGELFSTRKNTDFWPVFLEILHGCRS